MRFDPKYLLEFDLFGWIKRRIPLRLLFVSVVILGQDVEEK
jgi:hypothetical protein